MAIPQNGWFIMENPIHMDDLGIPGYPYFRKPPYGCNVIPHLSHLLLNTFMFVAS